MVLVKKRKASARQSNYLDPIGGQPGQEGVVERSKEKKKGGKQWEVVIVLPLPFCERITLNPFQVPTTYMYIYSLSLLTFTPSISWLDHLQTLVAFPLPNHV